jgi:hypothetical protein
MKKAISFIFSTLLFVVGLGFTTWAVIMWRKVGYHPGVGPTDSKFFEMVTGMGLGAIFCGFLGMRYYSLEYRMAARKRRRRMPSSGKQGILFSSQFEGKKFFVDKVISQALKEGIALSEAEKYMLQWTEVEEGFLIDEKLNEKFREETTDEEYEKKIRFLLKRAYESDVAVNPRIKEMYHSAYDALRDGDHYILIMVKDALGRKLR